MNKYVRNRLPDLMLLILAIASGLAWRAELELRSGWAGPAWLFYFHWAVPVCVLGFISWAVWFTQVQHTYWFVTSLLVFAFLSYLAIEMLLGFYLSPTSTCVNSLTFLLFGDLNIHFRWLWIFPWVELFLWILIPLAFCAILRGFGIRVGVSTALTSAGLFVASWPLAIIIRSFFDQRGGSDMIHALKSGFVIPFLVVALGIPLLQPLSIQRQKLSETA